MIENILNLFRRGHNLKKIIIKNGSSFQKSLDDWEPQCPQCASMNTVEKGIIHKKKICKECGCQYSFITTQKAED